MQIKKFTLGWLDFTVNTTLNPTKRDCTLLTDWETETIRRTAVRESEQQKLYIKKQMLRNHGKRRNKLINQYRSLLVMLLDQIDENMVMLNANQKHLTEACESIKQCAYDILTFIDSNYEGCAMQNQRIPKSMRIEISNEISSWMNILKSRLLTRIGSSHLSSILVHALTALADNTVKRAITVKEVNYKRALIKGLDQIHVVENESDNHRELVKILVYLNFNSRGFMNYYTQGLTTEINSIENGREKIARLLFYYKEFKQMHSKPGIVLNPNYDDLSKVVGNWFEQEIKYLEKKMHWEVCPLPVDILPVDQPKQLPFKVMCFLSVDQIALMLRAMDALRIVQARSLNTVIKTIAPFLSTPRKQEISWQSMRSKSYAVEESDREMAIKTLQSMINWIKEY